MTQGCDQQTWLRWGVVVGLAAGLVGLGWSPAWGPGPVAAQAGVADPLVFVSRAIPVSGHIADGTGLTGSLPGIGSISRFVVADPGRLLVREPDGRLRVLVDGSRPTAASLQLIDVHAPEVSYDGEQVVFAGLPAGTYGTRDRRPGAAPGAWRIYVIRADGTGLRAVTTTPPPLDLGQFPFAAGQFNRVDDTDPVWLPDGRIVFASTRWPGIAQYRDPRTTNLYVVNADGTGLHRITAERNGADRPLVDPVTGKIVYARWWRNGHFASDNVTTVTDPVYGGYLLHRGLSTDNPTFGLTDAQVATLGPANGEVNRNLWITGTVNPDGTALELWSGSLDDDPEVNSAYGGAFDEQGHLYANLIPLENLAEVAGFGGIRYHRRGVAARYALPTGVLGVTTFLPTLPLVYPSLERVYAHEYAAEPEVLPGTNQLVVSIAPDPGQDYGLYVVNRDGTGRQLLYDGVGTTEIRARRLRPRPLPPVLADAPSLAGETASLLPPRAEGPYDGDGTFVFAALNVYANAPVDVNIPSAPPIGSAGTIRFYADFVYDSPTTNARYNWPILLGERAVAPDGAVTEPQAPANIPLFEQLRTPAGAGYRVPVTDPPARRGAAHVAGQNFGRPGTVARCVGCHMGHTRMAVPATAAAARWTNLAPGAAATASSTGQGSARQLINRRARTEGSFEHWRSAGTAATSQWVQLTFPVPVAVRTVRLWAASGNPVQATAVRLYGDAGATTLVGEAASGAPTSAGTDVGFADVVSRVVRVAFTAVDGPTATLAEVEVIAAGVSGDGGGSTPPATPVLDPLGSALRVGGTNTTSGSGFTAGSVVKLFVAGAEGPLAFGPYTPMNWTSTNLSWRIPASVPMGNGFGSVQVVNTDAGFVASNVVGALLEGDPQDNLPTIQYVDGVALAPADPTVGLAHVDTAIRQGATVTIVGTGFNKPGVNLFTATGNVGPLTPLAGASSTQVQVVIPSNAPTGPGTFQLVNSPYTGNVSSNAVAAVIGAPLTITAVSVSGRTVMVTGSGFSPLSVVNVFNKQGTSVVNLGGLNGSTPKIPLTVVNDTLFTFTIPSSAVAGPAFVEVLNPPYIPFSSSGSNPAGAFTIP